MEALKRVIDFKKCFFKGCHNSQYNNNNNIEPFGTTSTLQYALVNRCSVLRLNICVLFLSELALCVCVCVCVSVSSCAEMRKYHIYI